MAPTDKDGASAKEVFDVAVVGVDAEASPAPDLIAIANDPHRGLRMRHVQLIAISGSIGSALFVSIGSPLTSAGPLGLLLGVIIWAVVVVCGSNCLIEMTSLFPVDGGFVSFANRFVDECFGSAVGWNYVITQWALICFELTAVNIIVSYWKELHPAILISVCLVVIGALNLYSVRWFGEAEFWISITKVLLIIGLTLYTFITMVGGNPRHDVYGFRYWKSPFAGQSGKDVVRGIFDAILWAAFGVVGPDYISLIAGEVRNPRRIIPRAFNTTIYRIFIFYVVGAFCVGTVVAPDDSSLLGAIEAGAAGAAKSPYVISMNRLGIPVLPSIVNAAVLVSIFSTANSFVFAASRSLLGLAQRGHAPRFLANTSKGGVPTNAIILTLLIGCLSYLSVSAGTAKVLNWWINVVTSAQLVTWTCIAITWLRFARGLKVQGIDRKAFLPAYSRFQPISAYWMLVWSPIVLLFSGYYLFYKGAFDAADFIFAYGSVFIFLAIYIGSRIIHFVRNRKLQLCIPASEIDFETDLGKFEEITRACDYKRESKANQPKSMVQKVSDWLF